MFADNNVMMERHVISLMEFEPKEIESIVDLGIKMKKNPKNYENALHGKTLAMLFQKTSTRTRMSFEVGMQQLGGHAVFLDWMKTQFQLADLRDETRALCRYCDAIMARLLRHEDLRTMASVATVPVINGCDEMHHPCQALADVMTIKEALGRAKGVRVAYLGIANNVSNSLSLATTATGMEFTLCASERHPPSLDHALLKRVKATGLYSETKEATGLKKAVAGADVLCTDSWVDMELFSNPAFAREKERRLKALMPFQINASLMKLNPRAKVMHGMPMHVGYEITRDAIESRNALIFDQAENRLHAQKALLLKLLWKV